MSPTRGCAPGCDLVPPRGETTGDPRLHLRRRAALRTRQRAGPLPWNRRVLSGQRARAQAEASEFLPAATAAATAAEAATAATTAPAATAAAEATTATAAAAIGLGARFVDSDLAAVDLLTVGRRDGRGGLVLRDVHEPEALVADQPHFGRLDSANRFFRSASVTEYERFPTYKLLLAMWPPCFPAYRRGFASFNRGATQASRPITTQHWAFPLSPRPAPRGRSGRRLAGRTGDQAGASGFGRLREGSEEDGRLPAAGLGRREHIGAERARGRASCRIEVEVSKSGRRVASRRWGAKVN